MEYEISHARGMLGLEVLVGAFLGLVAHHCFFIRGEWHVQAPVILWFHLSLFGTLILGNIVYAASGVGYIFKPALITSTCYLYTLFASIVLYRTLFHRLTKAGFQGALVYAYIEALACMAMQDVRESPSARKPEQRIRGLH